MIIRSILKSKGSTVETVGPDKSIQEVARILYQKKIGAVIVMQNNEIKGVLSERDIVRGLTRSGDSVVDLPVSALMSREVRTCRPDAEIRAVMRLMTDHRIRHLPVVDNGVLCGIVSIGDVVKSRLEDMEMEANVLRDYAVAHH